ncbi:hypothetical protein [Halorussus ruber]|uniref:hypothetical protein n=1 Tax=Halorussus ruber TaxID=1126238 RepID=UPI001091E3F7|nr:hypothetical protein [Halorussus ruber]
MIELGVNAAILFGFVGAIVVGIGAYQFGHYERVRRRSVALSQASWFAPVVAVPPIAASLGVADFFLSEISVAGLGALFPAIWPVAGVGLFTYAQVETYAAAEAIRHHPDVTAFDDDSDEDEGEDGNEDGDSDSDEDSDNDLVYRKSDYYRSWWTLVERHHPHALTASLAAFPFLSMAALVLMLRPNVGVRLAGVASFSLALYDLVLLGVVAGGTYRMTDDEEAAQVDRLVARRDAECQQADRR